MSVWLDRVSCFTTRSSLCAPMESMEPSSSATRMRPASFVRRMSFHSTGSACLASFVALPRAMKPAGISRSTLPADCAGSSAQVPSSSANRRRKRRMKPPEVLLRGAPSYEGGWRRSTFLFGLVVEAEEHGLGVQLDAPGVGHALLDVVLQREYLRRLRAAE